MIEKLEYHRIPAGGWDHYRFVCDKCGAVHQGRSRNVYVSMIYLQNFGWKFDRHYEGGKCTCPDCNKPLNTE